MLLSSLSDGLFFGVESYLTKFFFESFFIKAQLPFFVGPCHAPIVDVLYAARTGIVYCAIRRFVLIDEYGNLDGIQVFVNLFTVRSWK